MSERKVLNKYYPADYDPSKIPKGKRNRNATFNIRIMAPFNMRCNMCKEYIYKGKKFNSRKEDVMDETYLGLRIFRFYIKCPRCVSEIAFKTDLENTDYTLEAGAKRLFEAEKIAQQMAEEERKAKEEDEMNPMKMLENRTKASRAEMDQIDTLEELREMNTRKNQVNTDAMIEKYRKYEELLAQLQMEQEEEEIKEIFGEKGTKIVKRLDDSDSEEDGPPKKKSLISASSSSKPTDILAEESKPVAQKTQESWQKSVGSMSSQHKLKGFVKKKSTLPVLTAAKASSTAGFTAGQADNHSSNTVVSVKTNGLLQNAEQSAKDSETVQENSDTKNGTAGEQDKASNDKMVQSATGDGARQNDVDASRTVVGRVSSSANGSAETKSSGLGLLGAYSDSDSDTSS